jgi:tetratricopeptide (TPR) repeat protein
VDAAPQFAESRILLFNAALEANDHPTAYLMLQAAERTMPEGPDLWWTAYRYAQAVEDSETSERCLRRILQVDPLGVPPRLALAKELLQSDRIEEAEPILCTLCDAGVAEAAFYLGVNNVRHGDLAAALHWMERAQQLNPDHEPTREQVANLRRALSA